MKYKYLPEEDFEDTSEESRCRTDSIRRCTEFLPGWKRDLILLESQLKSLEITALENDEGKTNFF